ncbi:YitT family protein [Bacillus sp. RG28]|uniref:YitT family protein n=1 Tax=Gottfriedia endophytica TaxID=2820819 RepID=A0A940NNX5_9BACI|nr:YitT family protein [Gottfriedia endophytica]MBP0724196.1 YitT family protein [Gottfriedia endophytica]
MQYKLKIKNILFILLGAAIFSFGIVNFNMKNNLAEGGFTGINLILYFKFHISPSITNLVFNIPLFFIGWKLLGRITMSYTIIGTVAVSFFIWLFGEYPVNIDLHNDLMLVALFAGVFIGVGLGIIFRFGGTTGGVDIIARLANKYAGWSMGKTMFTFDFCVITLSLLTYLNYREAMYTLVAVFVGAKVIDITQEGAYAAKGANIISSKNELIAERIMTEMNRGATFLKGVGTFTGDERDVLFCVVPKNEIIHLKNIIQAIDPHAFVAVTDVHDVLGEGFTLDENKAPIHP